VSETILLWIVKIVLLAAAAVAAKLFYDFIEVDINIELKDRNEK
jgi:hypothetical protein